MSAKQLIQLEKDLWIFRKNEEIYWDWISDKTCFKGLCQDVTKNLVKYLEKLGYQAKRVSGYYNAPDIFFEKYFLDIDNGQWKHFWVIVNNTILVDTTADQFYPDNENDYRVICDLKNELLEYN